MTFLIVAFLVLLHDKLLFYSPKQSLFNENEKFYEITSLTLFRLKITYREQNRIKSKSRWFLFDPKVRSGH
jgi:hypothetical protein